jgi:hypothetical protein
MRLLILGSLGPYPERVATFVEGGHHVWYVSTEMLPDAQKLAGVTACHLWDLAAAPEEAVERLIDLIRAERIDAVYSLLNVWDGSNTPTALLLRRGCPVPVIRHYKEHYLAPSEDERICMEQSAGVIFINPESRDWFAGVYRLPERTACLDADLLPRRYLRGEPQPKLSARDHRPHLLIAGTVTDDGGRYDYRDLIREITDARAHVHLYGMFRRMRGDGRMMKSEEVEAVYRGVASSEYLHIHAPIPPERFVEAWSPYDAGLLHTPRADDRFRGLNLPNRYSAYIAAGLPVALPAGEMPAMQRHLEALRAAVVYENIVDLIERLPDEAAAAGAMAAREAVTFEAVYGDLISFIESCLEAGTV